MGRRRTSLPRPRGVHRRPPRPRSRVPAAPGAEASYTYGLEGAASLEEFYASVEATLDVVYAQLDEQDGRG